MKTALLSHLNPEEEIKESAEQVVTKPTGDLPWENSAPKQGYSLNTTKASVDSEIDSLFDI
jgi:hypothetical protein